jgi:hypothetical protein
MKMSGQSRAPAALLIRKLSQYPLNRVGIGVVSVEMGKSLLLPGFEPRIVYPIA